MNRIMNQIMYEVQQEVKEQHYRARNVNVKPTGEQKFITLIFLLLQVIVPITSTCPKCEM